MFYNRHGPRQQRALVAQKQLTHESPPIQAELPLATQSAQPERWAAYRQDNNGVDHIIAVELPDEASALARIDEILERQNKPHGQEFYTGRYPKGGLKSFKDGLNLGE